MAVPHFVSHSATVFRCTLPFIQFDAARVELLPLSFRNDDNITRDTGWTCLCPVVS